jgi:hypothetical protein
MTALVASIITAVVTAVLAAVGTYVTTRRNLQIQFDASLREMRITAYKELWARLASLAKYARPEPLSRNEAQELAVTLSDWYFQTGGLFLSQETRRDYFALLDGLEVLPRRASGATLSVEDDELLRVLGSRLRTGMTRDVGSRRTFIFREDSERAHRVARAHTYVEDGVGRRLRIAPRSWQRLPLIGRFIPGPPVLFIEGRAQSTRWDPSRLAFVATAPDADESGRIDERVFLVEAGHVIEGPDGWERGDVRSRGKSVIWREVTSEGGPETRIGRWDPRVAPPSPRCSAHVVRQPDVIGSRSRSGSQG